MSDETNHPPARYHPEEPPPPAISRWFAQSIRDEPFCIPDASLVIGRLERRRARLFASNKAIEDQFLSSSSSMLSHVTASTTAHDDLFSCIFKFAGCHSAYDNKFDWKQHVLHEHIHHHQLCHGPPCTAHPRVKQTPPEQTQCQSLGSKSSKLPQILIGVGSKSPSQQNDQPDEDFICPGCHLSRSLGCPAPGCSARFHGIAAWSLRLDHIAIHLGEMHLLFGGAEDTEFVQWASHSSVKIIVSASGGNGWLLYTPQKRFGIPSDSGYGSSIQTSSAGMDDLASRLLPPKTSGNKPRQSDASTVITGTEGPGDDSNDIKDMTTALYHLRFESTSLPSQESTASTDFYDVQHERSVSESAASHKSVGSDQSVITKNSFRFHMKTLFGDFGDIDDFVSKYSAWLFSQINEFSNAADEAQNLLYAGPGGENYYGSVSGSGSSPNSDQANSNGTGLLLHIPGGGNRGNDNDDDGSPNQNLNSSMQQPHHSDPREFACPFYKRAHENRQCSDCSKKRFLRFSRLLEHIKRTHTLNKFQCDRCLSQFASENEYNLHVDSTMKCAIVNYDKTGQATYGVLSSRSLYRGMDPEKRWIQTYCLLFPSEGTVPSPYYEDRCHYALSWDDGHILDYIRMRFPSETESAVQQLHSVLQYPQAQAENSIMDECIRKTGEAVEDLNESRPTQPADHIAEPEILNQDNFQLSHPYHDALSWEGTSSIKGFDCGQWDPVLGKYPSKTKDGPGNICISGSPPPENAFSHVEISETCDTHLSSPSVTSSGHESSEQHQNLNHEFTLHQLAMAVQNE